MWTPLQQLAFAAGLGIGIGVDDIDQTGTWTLRASPVILRVLNGRLEVGLHVQIVGSGGDTVALGLAAFDVFPF
mgnify:CR=1 FL=1